MATVRIPSRLRHLTSGADVVDVAAGDVRQLIQLLEKRFPGFGAALADGTAVAIDGEIFNHPMLEPIETDSEVDFLPRISGG